MTQELDKSYNMVKESTHFLICGRSYLETMLLMVKLR